MNDERPTCAGTTVRGEPCRCRAVLKNGYCSAHQPGGSEKMAELGRKGAAATARRWRGKGLDADDLPPLRTPADAGRILELTARGVATGELSASQGKAISALVRAWLASREAGEMADRVEALQEQLRALKARGKLKVAGGGKR